jgi:hypothetical protein
VEIGGYMKKDFTGFFDRWGEEICYGSIIQVPLYLDSIVFKYLDNKHPVAGLPTGFNKHFQAETCTTLECLFFRQRELIEELPRCHLTDYEQAMISKEPKTLLTVMIAGNVHDTQDAPWIKEYYKIMQEHYDVLKTGKIDLAVQLKSDGFKRVRQLTLED